MKLATAVIGMLVCLWMGFLLGQLHHAEKIAPRIGQLERDLRHAQRIGAGCHRTMADHWQSAHLFMPGSPEAIITSRLLADDLELPPTR